jgi:hypothetical protein
MDVGPPDAGAQKTVVLIGTPVDDGVTIKIHSLGCRYARRSLSSSPNNWLAIAAQLHKFREFGQLVGVIMLLTNDSIDRCLLPDYESAWQQMMTELGDVPSLAFVYEDVLDRISTDSPLMVSESVIFTRKNPDLNFLRVELPSNAVADHCLASLGQCSWPRIKSSGTQLIFSSIGNEILIREDVFGEARVVIEQAIVERNRRAKLLFDNLREAGIEIVPYRTRVDRVIRTQDFLDATVSGEFLRLYVPSGRYQGEQLASFLRLFKKYVHRIEGRAFSIDTRNTEHGTVYVFRSNDSVATLTGIEGAISRFEALLELYGDNPGQAEELLTSMGLEANEARRLLAEYTRDYQRLVMDMKHEYETKILVLRQELENRALEVTAPGVEMVTRPLSVGNPRSAANSLLAPPTLNIGDSANSSLEFEKLITGDISYTLLDRELIDLFEKYEKGIEAVRLKSDLEQLKDRSVPQELRVVSRQRIVGFLYRMMPRLGQSVVMQHVSYLNELLDGQ